MDHISLAHGNGGRLMRELIEELIARQLAGLLIDIESDAVALDIDATDNQIMFTTDGFIVQPLEFPGGDIGSLAIHGTVNDLCVSGATPLYLSLNMFIEEGLPIAQLERLLTSMARAAHDCNIKIAAGDTKVVRRGEGSGLYLATTGVGIKPRSLQLGMSHINEGDAILVSGPLGNHGIAVMLAREEFGLRGDVSSDAASVLPLTRALLPLPGLHFMRDPTRGGLATVLNEVTRVTGMGIAIDSQQLPINDAVQVVCDMLGYDPLYLACEGRVVAIVSDDIKQQALQQWQALPQGEQAAIIGAVTRQHNRVTLRTELGGERILEELEDDPLPRIC